MASIVTFKLSSLPKKMSFHKPAELPGTTPINTEQTSGNGGFKQNIQFSSRRLVKGPQSVTTDAPTEVSNWKPSSSFSPLSSYIVHEYAVMTTAALRIFFFGYWWSLVSWSPPATRMWQRNLNGNEIKSIYLAWKIRLYLYLHIVIISLSRIHQKSFTINLSFQISDLVVHPVCARQIWLLVFI